MEIQKKKTQFCYLEIWFLSFFKQQKNGFKNRRKFAKKMFSFNQNKTNSGYRDMIKEMKWLYDLNSDIISIRMCCGK